MIKKLHRDYQTPCQDPTKHHTGRENSLLLLHSLIVHVLTIYTYEALLNFQALEAKMPIMYKASYSVQLLPSNTRLKSAPAALLIGQDLGT
jgi:hypothetical protein